MKHYMAVLVALGLGTTAALADSKPSDEEAKKITETLSAMGCEGGEYEKETEGTGAYEVDDTKCKFGGQWDVKLDKDFKATSLTRD